MPKKPDLDVERLNRILQEQHQVITRQQALACGMSRSTVDHRISMNGAWQRLLPGVHLAVTGMPTQDQRDIAALLYAGPRSVITGPVAVRRHRLRSPGPDVVDVLVPWNVRRQSTAFVRIHRTRQMPKRIATVGKIRFAWPARAVADAARGMTRFDDVRAVVCEAVQRRVCGVAELTDELNEGPSAGSRLYRAALVEVGDGVRSVAEADFRRLIARGRLPKPMFNAKLFTLDGVFIAMVDAWWQDAGVAAEVDSRAYHLAAEDQDRTTTRHDKLVAHGVLPLHFSPRRIKTEPAAIVSEIRSAIEKGRQRPPLPLVAFPSEPVIPVQ
jgi:very-short-patch-repair endonuclease